MISLITTCDPQRLYLLPWFVKHYRACGVERFYINLHFDSIYPPEVQPELVARANAILRDLDLCLHSVYAGIYESAAMRRHHDAIQAEIAASTPWIVWADIDEFHEYTDSLAALTAYMRRHSIDYIQGFVVDRMARAGLPEFQGGVSPWRQFPLGSDITRSILGAWVEEIMLAGSGVTLAPGNHRIRSPASAKGLPGTYPVHHFKWDAVVVPRLERRLRDDWKERCSWWPESKRALDWLAGGRGKGFDGLAVYDFEDDRHPGDGGPFGGNARYPSHQAKVAAQGSGSVIDWFACRAEHG